MVKITTRNRDGFESTEIVYERLDEIGRKLAAAERDIVFFGEFKTTVMIHVSELVRIEEVPVRPPPVPTKAQLLERAAARRLQEERRAAATAARREACRGGTEILERTASGMRSSLVARPVDEVITDVVFAESGFAHVDDGLGSSVTVKAREVVDIRPFQ